MMRGGFERRRLTRWENYQLARATRAEEGFEPVRCCCSCELLGWLKHAGAVRIEAGEFRSTPEIVLTYATIMFGVLETGEPDPHERSESAWQSNDYTVEQLAQFPDFDLPTEHERLVDPRPSWTLAGYLPTDRGSEP